MNNKIRNEYPYPIAKVYLRSVNAEEPIEKFTMIGYLFEITLKYAASIVISEYLSYNTKDEVVNKILSGITRPSLGKWAEFLREILKYNLKQNKTIFNDTYFKRSSDHKKMIFAVNKINEQLNPDKPSNITTVSPEFFTNTFIQYRNKTKGHGAIQKADCQKINDILLDGMDEYILSFDIFNKYAPAYIRKIELDKHGKYNFSLQRLSGTDLIRAAYSTTFVDSSIRAGNICLCEPTEEGLNPLLSLHPLFIFIEDREEVYVLNEGELSRIEYLCYHRGGKDAIYSPDELREDFNARFGEIIGQDSVKIKYQPKSIEVSPSHVDTSSEEKVKKRPLLVPVIGISGFFIVLLFIVYFVFFNKSNQQKTDFISQPTQNPQIIQNQDSLKPSPKPGTSEGETTKEKSTTETPVEVKKQKDQSSEKVNELKTNKESSETPQTYITDPDISAIPKGRAEDNLDYTNLKMSSNFKGMVRVRAYINENGMVDKTETLGGGIDQRFNSAAENAVKKLNFTPASKGGKKVKSISTVNVTFQGTR